MADPPIALYRKAAQSAMCDTIEAESDIREISEEEERGVSIETWGGTL